LAISLKVLQSTILNFVPATEVVLHVLGGLPVLLRAEWKEAESGFVFQVARPRISLRIAEQPLVYSQVTAVARSH
jgi:uncharacterized protein YaiE (UPF0345 family)